MRNFLFFFTNNYKYDTVDVRFSSKGYTISYGLKKTPDWSKKKKLDSLVANSNGITDFRLGAEVSAEEKLLKIYLLH